MQFELLILQMFKKIFVFIVGLSILQDVVQGQDNGCHITFHGHVVDLKTRESIPGVSLRIRELDKIAVSDSLGVFKFTDMCEGKYTFICQSLGYDTFIKQMSINKSSHLLFELKGTELGIVNVTASQNNQALSTVSQTTMEGIAIDQVRGESLGESLKDITGLNSIQTGPGVSKPVIHGLYSNRILILNNGVGQEGQQWGSDHAPEIDPFTASEITVIKGAESVRYGSDAMGGVVSLEPKPMPHDPGIDGDLNLIGASNNGMGVISGMFEGAFDKSLSGLSWRVQGTLKDAGNSEAPGYYLDNTAIREQDYSGQLSYRHKNYALDVYYSSFNSTSGILTASEVGNIADLDSALKSKVPNEKSRFSYLIRTPYQTVTHDLLKASGYIYLSDVSKLQLVYSRQDDIRQEFAPDASNGSNDSLADYFHIITNSSELEWQTRYGNNFTSDIGMSGSTQENFHQTVDYFGVIPNFLNYGGGLFAIEKWQKGFLTIEGGLRYDYLWLQMYMYNQNLQYTAPIRQYSHVSGTIGATYQVSDHLTWSLNYGNAWRPPEPNELYGMGVHLSAASFEQGDSSLKVEQSNNFSTAAKFQNEHLSVELGLYYNIINNFIFLEPTGKPKYLISGVMPGFQYTQANVIYKGIDLDINYHITTQLSFTSKTTIVRAFNYSINDYLIYVPADRFDNGFKYEFKNAGRFKKPYLALSNVYVAHQNLVPSNSYDYAPPPPAYTLFNAGGGFFVMIARHNVEVNITVTDILNTAYRDYLDRLRYFSDEPGRNIMLRLKMPLWPEKTVNQ